MDKKEHRHRIKEAAGAFEPLSFSTIFFPALVRVSNYENRPQNCAERLEVTLHAPH
jgi:hypothetical protein